MKGPRPKRWNNSTSIKKGSRRSVTKIRPNAIPENNEPSKVKNRKKKKPLTKLPKKK